MSRPHRLIIGTMLVTLVLPVLAAQTGPNLVQNPGFEDGIEGWDERQQPIVRDDDIRFTGEYSCKSVGHEGLRYPDLHWVKSADIPAEPNREYLFEIMVKADVEEGRVAPQVREVDEAGKTVNYHRAEMLGAGEHDWHQASTRFVTSPAAHHLQVYLVMRDCIGTAWYDDVALRMIEPEPLPEVGTGAAVTFEGSPGALDMRVEAPRTVLSIIPATVIETTGARFRLSQRDGALIISATQRIGAERESYELRIEPPPGRLEPLRTDETVVVLGNENLELGFQCDSLLAVAPGRATTFTVTGAIGGEWTQSAQGNVQVTDGRGGVGVYPYVLPGSGVTVDLARESSDLSAPGWTCSYTLDAGALLGLSIYPCREYDWERSFDWQLAHTNYYPPDSALQTWSEYVELVTLHQHIWVDGNPGGPYDLLDEDQFRRVIATCERLGLKLIPYTSPYYYIEPGVDAFMAQLEAQKAEHGFHGTYYDGLYFRDWVKSYEVMRRTRELFPEGPMYLHTSWGPPVGTHDMSCPFIDTYADVVLRGESRETRGADAPYVDYIASGYMISNAVGLMKGNRWDVPYEDQLRIMLSHNGRERLAVYPSGMQTGELHWPGEDGALRTPWTEIYWPLLQQMRGQWEAGTLEF